jgi:hypothetical protein
LPRLALIGACHTVDGLSTLQRREGERERKRMRKSEKALDGETRAKKCTGRKRPIPVSASLQELPLRMTTSGIALHAMLWMSLTREVWMSPQTAMMKRLNS